MHFKTVLMSFADDYDITKITRSSLSASDRAWFHIVMKMQSFLQRKQNPFVELIVIVTKERITFYGTQRSTHRKQFKEVDYA